LFCLSNSGMENNGPWEVFPRGNSDIGYGYEARVVVRLGSSLKEERLMLTCP